MGWGQVDDQESIRAIRRAIDLGVNFFDTANNYGAGHSERVLGQALAGVREQVVIATKFGSVFDEATASYFDDRSMPMTASALHETCDASLRRLQTDCIDLYLFHDGEYDPAEAGAVCALLEDLVRSGKIRWYGWSTDDPARARIFAQGSHCAAVEYRLNLFYDAPEMVALCQTTGLGSIIKQPLNSGLLTGKFRPDTSFPSDDGRQGIDFSTGRGARRLEQIAALRAVLTQDGRTLAQGALGWIWARHPAAVPIPGFKYTAQVEDNAGAAAFGPLRADQMAEIDRLLQALPV